MSRKTIKIEFEVDQSFEDDKQEWEKFVATINEWPKDRPMTLSFEVTESGVKMIRNFYFKQASVK